MADGGSHLTTSRVNRLLRPLRNKCNSLAALLKSAATSRATYSKQTTSWDPNSRPPLSVLPFPAGTKKLVLDTRSADEFELSRRIHAVCHAFKNIAHVAFNQPCNERIPSLAAMCALVVGENIPDSDKDSADDVLDVDAIYDAVPSHYRRFFIVSHALSMILAICAHHHTLLTMLLDHCLSFGLVHESTRLLNIVLTQALLPSNSYLPPPIIHPGHTGYLLDLHMKWTAGNNPSGTSLGTSLFTTSAFCQGLLGILSQSSSSDSYTIWTSKVLNRLLHAVESCDVDTYIFITHALSQSLSERASEVIDQNPNPTSLDAPQSDTQLAILRGKLSELMSNLFDLLFTRHDPHSYLLEPSRTYATIDILCNCHAARLHRSRTSTPGSSVALPDIIAIFTAHIFVTFRNSIHNSDGLLAILDDLSPIPTTFSKLVSYISRFQGGQTFGDFVEVFLSELKIYSSAFCSENLFRLDASLWACALHHFETSMATSQKGNPVLVKKYKRQLMEAVDIAERRCFGGLIDSPIISSIRPTRTGRTHHARTSGHWEWEDMVGSWIRKTPVHNKRKINDSPLLRCVRSRLNAATSTSVSTPLSIRNCRSPIVSSSSSYSQSSDPESHTEDGSEYQETDKENYPSSPLQEVKGSRRLKHRGSNFFSLLADAQMSRVVLHSTRSKPRSSSTIPEKYVLPLPSQESRNSPCKQEKETWSGKRPPPPAPSRTILLSDDSLDLFAYATSSPAGS